MAGRFSVEAVFKAVDRVTAPVSRMQTRISKFTRGVSRGLRSANRQVDKLVNGMRRGLGRVLKFGGALAAVGGAAVVTALNRTAASADALAKQSRRLMFPIEELQEWKFVAEQSGVSNELLDKSLGAFSKRLGEAKSGMGPLVSGLKDLNPRLLQQLQATDDVGKAFELYINAMREADTATEKAALANAAFSRSGLNLVNIADNSSAAIAALRNEQRENGNITMEQAEAAEAYGDAVNSLKRGLMGMMQQVLLPMMPMITENVRQWREWVVANREMIQSRVIEFAKNLWARLKDLVAAVAEFNDKYDLGARLSEGLDVLGKFARFLGENGALILKLVVAVVAVSAALKVLAAVMAVVNLVMALNPIGLIVIGIGLLIAAIAAAIFWWDEIKAAMLAAGRVVLDTVVGAFEWLRETFLGLPGPAQAAIGLLTGPIGWLVAASALITDNWTGIKEFFTDLWGGVVEVFDASVGRIMALVDKVKGAADKISSMAGGAVDKAKDAANQVGDALSNAGSNVAGFFGFGDDDEDEQQAGANGGSQVVSPQERTARSIEESRSTSTAEVTIRDESGRAEVTRGQMGNGVRLQPTGGF